MRRLAQQRLLEGREETITLSELRACPGDVFAQVQQGKSFTVTRQGRPIAVIKPPELTALALGAACRAMERPVP